MDDFEKPQKAVFNRGKKSEKTSLSLSRPMLDALNEMSEYTGKTVPEVIVSVLEVYLNSMVKNGILEAPKDLEATVESSRKSKK